MKKIILLLTNLFFLNLNCIKIDRVILSTNDNENYIQFWPIVAKVWKELIGAKPTLALIADKSVKVDESLGDVIRFEPIKDIPTSIYAQCIRLLLPAYFEEDVCIISDIDMIPVNKEYFIEPIKDFPDDCFIVYKNGYYEFHSYHFMLPMCYNVAKGKVFKEIFNIQDIKDIESIMKDWFALNEGYRTDELMLYKYLVNWKNFNNKCIKLGHYDDRRINRLNWGYCKGLLKNGYYVDAHCLRPYNAYKQQIDELVRDLELDKNDKK